MQERSQHVNNGNHTHHHVCEKGCVRVAHHDRIATHKDRTMHQNLIRSAWIRSIQQTMLSWIFSNVSLFRLANVIGLQIKFLFTRDKSFYRPCAPCRLGNDVSNPIPFLLLVPTKWAFPGKSPNHEVGVTAMNAQLLCVHC